MTYPLTSRRALAITFLCSVPLSAQNSSSPRPSIAALAIDKAISVDGELSEAAWAQAEVGGDFAAREPNDNRPAAERTEFSILYTPSTLYFGIRAYDSQPDAIIAREMQRDADLGSNDDAISIILDTFHDQRNSFMFEINPNGARTDALITDEGKSFNLDWDGVWAVATSRSAQGWFAEVAIPFTTLRFNPGGETWGLNLRRVVRRTNEESNWAAIGREITIRRSSPLYGAHYVSLAGDLTGIGTLRAARRLDVKPFVVGLVGEEPRSENRHDDDVDVGLDVKWGVTKSLTLDLTYNTDFAQVEVDQQQVNITRFPLFFPEKRDFFLENAGIFEFGPPQTSGARPPLMKAFFSRRIGLDQGQEVPIDYGGRLTGRVGAWNVGMLAVSTDAVDEEGRSSVPEELFGVFRLKRNLGERSSVGIIVTERDPSGAGFNRLYGLDLDYKPTTTSSLYLFGAESEDEEKSEDSGSFGTGFSFTRRSMRGGIDIVQAQKNFDPGMGFLRRTDFIQYRPALRFEPRVNKWFIRSWTLDANLDYFERESTGEMESRRLSLTPIGMRTNGDDRFRIAWNHETEQLFEPFEIQPGIVIPPGLYDFDSAFMRASSSEGRRVRFRGTVDIGEFFEGDRESYDFTTIFRASKHLRSELSWNFNDVSMPQGDFETTVYGLRLDLSFSPDLRINTFAQYNDAAELVGLNVRLNWIYKPGADLFVVYNENWDAPTFSARETFRRELIVKYTYLWQP